MDSVNANLLIMNKLHRVSNMYANETRVLLAEDLNVPIYTYVHPSAEELHKSVMKEVEGMEFPMTNKTNVKAQMTDWRTNSPSIETITTWIQSEVYSFFQHSHPKGFKIDMKESWIARYSKGDRAIKHNHAAAWLSYVYFVNCPKGSSPLILGGGKKVNAEEGKVVVFPAFIDHEVPENQCDNRVVLAGNMLSSYS